ncbi:hypothetical protein R6Q57_007349 [Mikania cordata]
MERTTTRLYKRVKGYWRRKRYERLGGKRSGPSWRRFWRIRVTRKLKLKLKYTPKKLIIGLRDGYVNLMMRLANSQVVAGTGGYGEGVAKFGTRPVKEYDEKVIIDFYKTLVTRQAQLIPIVDQRADSRSRSWPDVYQLRNELHMEAP